MFFFREQSSEEWVDGCGRVGHVEGEGAGAAGSCSCLGELFLIGSKVISRSFNQIYLFLLMCEGYFKTLSQLLFSLCLLLSTCRKKIYMSMAWIRKMVSFAS
jgi:hypothetical protein